MEQASFLLSTFTELESARLYDLLRLRAEVFVVEQNCVYNDIDGLDQHCLHLEQLVDDQLVGYARLLPPKIDFADACAIGRVVTAPKVRRQGYGVQLMEASIQVCHQLWPAYPIKLHAQSYLLRFYARFGFRAYGEEFLEDGIPHYFMELPSPSATEAEI